MILTLLPDRGVCAGAISAFLIDHLKVNRRCETVCPQSAAFWGAAVLMNAWSGLLVLIAE